VNIRQLFGECTIREAALATSATPFYFLTAKVNGTKFWDSGLEYNNPIDEVWAEKGPARPECVISLGTGISAPVWRGAIIPASGKVRKILNNLTKVEGRHRNFEERMGHEGAKYFRFNPPMANHNIGLADHQKLDVLEVHTRNFLESEAVKEKIKRCAECLVKQQTERWKN
jgi:predicted acylesterase/phospholipase RssA